jgi:hypothetical protein
MTGRQHAMTTGTFTDTLGKTIDLIEVAALAVEQDDAKGIHAVHLSFGTREEAERLYSLIQRLR